MKICFLTLKDPEDKRTWSGIFYQMFANLSQYHEVEWIGHVELKVWQKILLKPFYYYNMVKKKGLSVPNIMFCRYYAMNIKSHIEKGGYDVIFAPVSSTLIAFLDTNIPIMYASDATFERMVNYYPEFTGLSKKDIRNGNAIDIRALKRVKKAFFSSEWARSSAVNFYKMPPEKAVLQEFGANLLYEPQANELDFSTTSICNILFLGVNWARKGGDIAYRAFLKLKNQGLKCTFTVVGCNPAIDTSDKDVTVIPFINKNDKEDFDRLYQIMLKTHFLLLPSRAECFGIVFSEASAFGIPSITTNTGGIPSAVENEVNGYLLDLAADENDYAAKISSVFSDQELFRRLRETSRKTYETRLSWKIWAQNFNKHLNHDS